MRKKKAAIIRRRSPELSPYERNAVPLEQIEAELWRQIEAFETAAVRYWAERANGETPLPPVLLVRPPTRRGP
jgi:hypothetical protein